MIFIFFFFLKKKKKQTILTSAFSSRNRWLASISFWYLGEKEKSLRVILEPLDNFEEYQKMNSSSRQNSSDSLARSFSSLQVQTSSFQTADQSKEKVDTSLLIFYEWFKKLPIFKNLLYSLRYFLL